MKTRQHICGTLAFLSFLWTLGVAGNSDLGLEPDLGIIALTPEDNIVKTEHIESCHTSHQCHEITIMELETKQKQCYQLAI